MYKIQHWKIHDYFYIGDMARRLFEKSIRNQNSEHLTEVIFPCQLSQFFNPVNTFWDKVVRESLVYPEHLNCRQFIRKILQLLSSIWDLSFETKDKLTVRHIQPKQPIHFFGKWLTVLTYKLLNVVKRYYDLSFGY